MSLSVKEYICASLLLVGFPQAVLAQQQRPVGTCVCVGHSHEGGNALFTPSFLVTHGIGPGFAIGTLVSGVAGALVRSQHWLPAYFHDINCQ